MNKNWTDAEMLEALRLKEQGWTCSKIAVHFGVSKNSIGGMLWRINKIEQ